MSEEGLPGRDEIIVTSEGLLLMDGRNPLCEVGLGRQVGQDILCG
jgi:hypothetical protein